MPDKSPTAPPRDLSQVARRAVRPVTMAAIGGVGLYLLLFLQTGAWQMLALAAFTLAAAGLIEAANRFVQRGRLTEARLALIGTIGGMLVGAELVISGLSVYLLFVGLLLIITVGLLPLGKRGPVPILIALAAYVVTFIVINAWQPLPRFSAQTLPILMVFVIGATLIAVTTTGLGATRAFQIGSIRTRLIIATVVLVIVPVAASGVVSSLLSAENNRNRALDALEAIAVLKESQVNAWADSLSAELNVELARDAEQSNLRRALLLPADSVTGTLALEAVARRFNGTVELRQIFEDLLLLDSQGRVLVSTNPNEVGKIFRGEVFFNRGLRRPYQNPPEYEEALGRLTVMTSAPVTDQYGRVIGVIAGRASLKRLEEIMSVRAGLGETGETYLVGANFAFLTKPRLNVSSNYVRTSATTAAIREGQNGRGVYTGYAGHNVYGVYRWLPSLSMALLAEQEQSEILASANATLVAAGVVTVLVLALAVAAALVTARSIGDPILRLARTVEQVQSGDLTARAEIERNDEVGVLADTFNRMTAQLRSLIGSLEERVAERTAQLKTSAEVGRAAVSQLDPERLLTDVVNLITDRFGFYYAAVFVIDDSGKWAVLRSATGEAGRVLLERGHRLEVGGQSMVGYVTRQRRSRIALDVGQDAVRFANPLLPDTRSEIALPLMVGERVLGVLDVQSTQAEAFDEASAAVLQSMADQIAVALNNSEQFKQTRAALQRAHTLYTASQAVSAAVDPDSVLRATITHIAPDAAYGSILWYGSMEGDEQVVQVELMAAWANPDAGPGASMIKAGMRFTPQQLPLIDQVTAGQAFSVPDRDAPYLAPGLRTYMERLGAQAMVVLPLAAAHKMLGLIEIGFATPRQFTDEQLQSMQALANQAAIALQNLQSAAETQRVLRELDAVNRRLTGEAWADFTRTRRAEVQWIGVGEQAEHDHWPEVAEALRTGQVATTAIAGDGQLGVAVPIVLRDTPVGVMRLVMPRRAFTDEARATLEALAGHVSQAVETARLLEQTERLAQRERTINEINSRVRQTIDLDAILRTAVNELGRSLKAARVVAHIGREPLADGNGRGDDHE